MTRIELPGDHPYLPASLKLDHYVENDKSNVKLLSTFFGILFVCLVAVYLIASRNKHARKSLMCQMKICWFFSCGFIHTILEGYYFFNYRTLASSTSFLAQMWKEYSMCDSRYVSGDTFVVCMEGITALVNGPLAFYAVSAFLSNNPARYVVQLVLSLCQIYGDILYLATEYLGNFEHGPFGDPLYFWFYFVFLNVLWIIIPFFCISESLKVLTQASLLNDSNAVLRTKGKKSQ